MRRGTFAATVLGCICACGTSQTGFDGGTGKMQPPLDTVAKDLATQICTRRFACMAYAMETRAFGDTTADCITEQTGYEKRSLSAPGVSPDYTQLLKCVDEMKTASCQAFIDATLGGDSKALPECSKVTPGSVATGGGCAYDRQCATGHCKTIAEGECGQCSAEIAVGAACDPTTDACDSAKGALCNDVTNVCIVVGRRGDTCASDVGCLKDLICDPMMSQCVDRPSTVGAACDPTRPNQGGCSFQWGAGLVCNTMSMMCELPNQNGLSGASCGVNKATGGVNLCGVGFICNGAKDGFSGKCVSGHAAPLGSPCSFTGSPVDGPACEGEAQCISGKCSVVDPTTCH